MNNISVYDAIKEHVKEHHERWTPRLIIALITPVLIVIGQWYVTQYRVDELAISMKEIAMQVEKNKQTIVMHIQWELQHQLEEKQREINRLRRLSRNTK